jgi:hypothetical protein
LALCARAERLLNHRKIYRAISAHHTRNIAPDYGHRAGVCFVLPGNPERFPAEIALKFFCALLQSRHAEGRNAPVNCCPIFSKAGIQLPALCGQFSRERINLLHPMVFFHFPSPFPPVGVSYFFAFFAGDLGLDQADFAGQFSGRPPPPVSRSATDRQIAVIVDVDPMDLVPLPYFARPFLHHLTHLPRFAFI